MKRKPSPLTSPVILHSWSISDWPSAVFPNSPQRARYFVRVRKRDLIDAGALIRCGRSLVILGAPFERWLTRQAAAVPEFIIAANGNVRERRA